MRKRMSSRWTCVIYLIVFFAVLIGGCTPKSEDIVKKPKVKAGAYYFDGWSTRTDRIKSEFADLEPEWGWEAGTQEIMDKQIDYAADNGLAFWAFDWYYPESDTWRGKSGYTHLNHPLNDALGLFLKSEKKERLEFCLLVANHEPFRVYPKDWDKVCDIWIDLFKQDNHFKIEGKPLVIIYHPHQFVESFGGPAGLKKAFDKLREKTAAAGLPDVLIAACSSGASQRYIDAGYDAFTGYNFRGKAGEMLGLPRGSGSTFEKLAEMHEKIWGNFNDSPLPNIPLATLGWDNRSRYPEKNMKSPYFWFTKATPDQIITHVKNAIEWVDAHPDKNFEEKVIMIFSWNEIAEGAYLVPTKKDGDLLLKALSGVLF